MSCTQVQRTGLLTIRSNSFVRTCIPGLATLRALLIIDDVGDSCKSFDNLCIVRSDVADTTDIDCDQIICALKAGNVVIGCEDSEWSCILYALMQLSRTESTSNISVIEHLKYVVDEKYITVPTDDTFTDIATLFANHDIYGALSLNADYGDKHDLFEETHLKYFLMIANVFGGNRELAQVQTSRTDDIRPPIPPVRGVLAGPQDLQEVDPGVTMPDTNLVKPSEFPDPEDSLGITTYDKYAPTPLPEEDALDSVRSSQTLAALEADLYQMMGDRLYNKEYAKDMLHSGMTVDEVYTVLTI